jgi:fused signal recognition particle receptor
MFRRRRDEPADRATPPSGPMTVQRPRREPSGMGLPARPSGLGARLRSILSAGAPATEATWDEVEEALIGADVGAETTLELVEAARARVAADGGRSGEEARRALATEIRDRLVRVD